VFVTGSSLQAQGSRSGYNSKVGCVNIGFVFNEYQRRKDLNDEMAELQATLEQEERDRRQKIESRQKQLETLDPADPTYVERAQELLELQIDYKNWGEVKRAHMSRELGMWSVKIYEEILTAIAEIAEAGGYDLVIYRGQFEPVSMEMEVIMEQIRTNQVLYAHPAVDMSQQVLDLLEKNYRGQPKQKMLYVP
jgi:Skp family chaperone for outer membrane proteins